VELADCRYLTHGNHLLYGLLGSWFYRLWQVIGYRGPALVCLQTLDSLLGGVGVGLFYLLCRNWELRRDVSVLACCGLGLSEAYWLWSLEAQVYLLGAFFVLLSACEASRKNPKPAVVGFWQALAALGHISHIMFAPAAIFLLSKSKTSFRRNLLIYAATLLPVIAGAYFLAGFLCVAPQSWSQLRIWLLGSAALTGDHTFQWHGGLPLSHCGAWALTTLRLFSDAPGLSRVGRLTAWALSAVAVVVAFQSLRFLKTNSRLVLFALIWMGGYLLLFSSWEPGTLVYRITDLIPLWLLIALVVERCSSRQRIFAAGFILSLGLFNGVLRIIPLTDSRANSEYAWARELRRTIPEDGWVLSLGIEQVYVPYFGHRRPLIWESENGKPWARTLELLGVIKKEKGTLFVPVGSWQRLDGQGWLAQFCAWNPAPASRGGFYECRPK
jgi:hypothetical protein